MIVDKANDPADERWWTTPRARRLFFTLLAVLGLAAVILLVFPIFRSPAPPADNRVFSEAPDGKLPLPPEEEPLEQNGGEVAETPVTGTEGAETLSPIDQLLSDEQPPVEQPPPSAPPAAPPALQSVTKLPVKSFWVQLGAYSSRAKAEESAAVVKQEFDPGDSLKIEEVLLNKQKIYRLRLGPYPSKEESLRVMELVRSVEMFHESYILNG